jgi:hypothetical protein
MSAALPKYDLHKGAAEAVASQRANEQSTVGFCTQWWAGTGLNSFAREASLAIRLEADFLHGLLGSVLQVAHRERCADKRRAFRGEHGQ